MGLFDKDMQITHDLTFKEGNWDLLVPQNYKFVLLIDVGAYDGDTIVYLAQKYGIKKAIAYEPNTALHYFIAENCVAHGIECDIYPYAIGCGTSQRNGTIDIPLTDKPAIQLAGAVAHTSAKAYGVTIHTQCIGNTLIVPPQTLAKVDCEGCEHNLTVHLHESSVLLLETDNIDEFIQRHKEHLQLYYKKQFYGNWNAVFVRRV